jgi:1-acyl-sn-glycerol-3-phosphate acyltransferase
MYIFLSFGISKITLRGGEHIFDAYKRALDGESRCLIAFRHAYGWEPQLLVWYILFKLRSEAKKHGVRFPQRPHAFFIYGYEVVRWGGLAARMVMPGIGAMPIHHTKIDSAGMARILKAIFDGPYPLALAPEGQVSYTAESVPRLEQGVVRIGFQAAERFVKEEKNVPVEILPISVHARFGKGGQRSLDKLLTKIEKYTGFYRTDEEGLLPERLGRIREFILKQNENRYSLNPEPGMSFNERVEGIMEAALVRAEEILGIDASKGDIVERVYHIRQICWDLMIIPGISSFKDLSPLEHSLVDLHCGEAWYASRHMELVDFIWYFRAPIPEENAPIHVKIEYVQNLWDFANRTMGGAYTKRILNVHPKRVLIQAAPVINLSSRLGEYQKNKKEAVNTVMDDMKNAFLDCIRKASEYRI